MPHVQQRFLVHRFVLEDGEGGFRTVEERMARLIEVRVRQRVEHSAVGFGGELLQNVASRPSAASVLALLGGVPRRFVRIDAAHKQRFKAGVDTRLAETTFTRVLKLNAGRWPSSEDNRMP